ncbi:MAG: DUF167 domain-containing protein [Pseudonocardia sp.]|nr:DUF167 domain-containing protein [Pseudonocardia sp.]
MKITVRVRPGARGDGFGGRWDGPRGPALIVAVRARAVEGGANAAVADVLAEAFGLRRGDVGLVAGARSRDKTVELVGDESRLRERLEVLLGG